jgi:hypothetical protein
MSETGVTKQSELPAASSGRVEMAEVLSVTSRKASRDNLQTDIEAFLAGGGKIVQVDNGASADQELQS